MSTGDCRPRGEGRASAPRMLVALLVLCLALAGCTLDDAGDPPPAAPATASAADEVRDLLDRRARAVRRNDLRGFLSDVARGGGAFRDRQRTYFENLQELPLAQFRYDLSDGSVSERGDGRVRAVVRLRMQLEGYDAHPVVSPYLLRFRRDQEGRLRLVDDRDERFAEDRDLERAPWDLTAIEVVEGDGVLGIFDRRSVDAAYQIIPSVEEGIADVSGEVPLSWSRSVVVYALSDVGVLAALDNLPGGDPDRLDGVAFPVAGGVRGNRLAGIRFMLHPRMVDRDDETRARLIRHELTHVALGRRDDRVPTWLSEGIAEYVSVQPIPPFERMISRDAVDAARAGVRELPADGMFNGPQSGANYGIAWYACEHIATVYGEGALWRLFEAMRARGSTGPEERARVLRDVLGLGPQELAAAAGRRILDTFG